MWPPLCGIGFGGQWLALKKVETLSTLAGLPTRFTRKSQSANPEVVPPGSVRHRADILRKQRYGKWYSQVESTAQIQQRYRKQRSSVRFFPVQKYRKLQELIKISLDQGIRVSQIKFCSDVFGRILPSMMFCGRWRLMMTGPAQVPLATAQPLMKAPINNTAKNALGSVTHISTGRGSKGFEGINSRNRGRSRIYYREECNAMKQAWWERPELSTSTSQLLPRQWLRLR